MPTSKFSPAQLCKPRAACKSCCESRAQDVNDELRAWDAQIRGTALQYDLDLLLDRGELTRSLLTELWAKFKFKAQDERLIVDIAQDIRTLNNLALKAHVLRAGCGFTLGGR